MDASDRNHMSDTSSRPNCVSAQAPVTMLNEAAGAPRDGGPDNDGPAAPASAIATGAVRKVSF
jgi:hypothetical protein